jgi:hypothetical protein
MDQEEPLSQHVAEQRKRSGWFGERSRHGSSEAPNRCFLDCGAVTAENQKEEGAPLKCQTGKSADCANRWQTFDPRNNAPRTGRILMARGRDAADVALSNAFGPAPLARFAVLCEPV